MHAKKPDNLDSEWNETFEETELHDFGSDRSGTEFVEGLWKFTGV